MACEGDDTSELHFDEEQHFRWLCKKNKFEYPRIITKRSRASVDSCSELGNTFAGLKVVFRELSP